MAEYTPGINLYKPNVNDEIDVHQSLSENFSKIDETLADNAKKTDGVISITDFDNLVLNKGQVNEDWKNAFQAAINAIKTKNQKLVFPTGIYQYSVSPNWAVDDAQIVSDGEVRLRYTGTDHAVIIDGVTGANSNVWNMTFGRFIVEAPSTAKDGVYINRVHHSHFDLRVRGAGTGYAGINVLFTVCDTFNIEVSSNPEGWYQNAKPQIGLRLSKFSTGLIPSYNTFINPIIEHTVQGGKIEDSLGNVFLGGTMEGCDDNGLWLTADAGLNKFFGLDLEANVGNDIYCLGFQNEFHGVDSTKIVDFGSTAKDNLISGGSYKTVILEASSTRNILANFKYNRELFDGTTGTLTDNGVKNRISNPVDIKNNKVGLDKAVTFNGGWVTDATLNQPFKMVKDTDGFINLSGTISSPNSADASSGFLLFTLPTGFRPLGGYVRFSVYNGATNAVISIDSANGEVRLISGTNNMLSFNGVRFLTA